MTDEPIDLLNTIVEFYDPHPGLAGAGARLPEPLRQIANSLAGKKVSLRKAKEEFEGTVQSTGEVSVHSSYISIRMPKTEDAKKNMCVQHGWKVISYRPEIEALDDDLTRRIKKRAEAWKNSPEGQRITKAAEEAYKKSGNLHDFVAIMLGAKRAK